jgi:ABC-type phosphate/phosphonate transport system substrate-binding protein
LHTFSLIRSLVILLLASCGSAQALAQGGPLHFGVFPNLSTRVLFEVHQPLADYLAHALRRPVYLETAPDFSQFVSRTRAGRYDLLLTAPHLAYLAATEAGYRSLFTYENPVQGVLVVRTNAPYRRLEDLKGAIIAMADPLAISVMMMEAELKRAGLVEGRDFTRLEAGSHNNAAMLVVHGRAQAGVLGTLPFRHLSVESKRKLRALGYSQPVLSQVYMVGARLSAADVDSVKAAFEAYAETPAGRAFFRQAHLGGLTTVSPGALEALAPFAKEAVRRLAHGAGS